MAYDLTHLSSVWSRITQLIADHGRGTHIYTTDGKKYLDFTSGIGVTNTGHCHPKVVTAIQQQAEKFLHAQVNCYFHPQLAELSVVLNEVTPESLDTFFFSNSGAEAVEGAVKLARHHTRRSNVIVFQGGFHGRTAMTMALTTAKTVYRVNYQPLPGGVFVTPFPYGFRYNMNHEEVTDWALRELDLVLHTQTAPEETAAMLIEPVLGEGGYVPAPPNFLQQLREICSQHGIMLIIDEVQSGFGRTGRFFAHEYAQIEPDIMIMAKGMASGVPISAIGASQGLMRSWKTGTHGGTYGGNPIACAAAIATVRVIQEEGLVRNAAQRGKQLVSGLRQLQKQYATLGDVRGLGLMVGTEFVNPKTQMPDADYAKTVASHALEHGQLILLTCGAYGNTIRWIPPLIVTEQEVDEALQIFENALRAAGNN